MSRRMNCSHYMTGILSSTVFFLSLTMSTGVFAQEMSGQEPQEKMVQDDASVKNTGCQGKGSMKECSSPRKHSRGNHRRFARMKHQGMFPWAPFMMGHRMRGSEGLHDFIALHDSNKDGRLEKKEFLSSLKTEYDRYNTSKDNKLTVEQFEKLWTDKTASKRVRAFQFFDGDGSNDITKIELQKNLSSFISFFDQFGEKGMALDGENSKNSSHKMPGRGMMRQSLISFSKTLDLDNDGYVTSSEAEKSILAQFEEADIDKDGKLSQEEFSAVFLKMAKPMQVRAFQSYDGDGDMTISFDEFQKKEYRHFMRWDRNGDDVIDQSDRMKRGSMRRKR